MPYETITFNPETGLDREPRVANRSYVDKHDESSRGIIGKKVEQIEANPNAFNGEKAIFYLKDGEDRNILKIVPEDYASVSAALELNRKQENEREGAFLRPHYAAGVIVVCKTSDDRIIIGSRDANRDRSDPSLYPLQFPCGFIDVNEEFYNSMRQKNPAILNQELISNAKRELREEVLDFTDSQIARSNSIGAIYETKQWPVKPEKGGGTKDIHVIKSFVVEIDVNMTSQEILEKRDSEIKKLNSELDSARALPFNEDNLKYLEDRKKDFDEISQIGFLETSQLSNILSGRRGTEAEIDFDGKNRKFVAEHGMTINIVKDHLDKSPVTAIQPSGVEKYTEEKSMEL